MSPVRAVFVAESLAQASARLRILQALGPLEAQGVRAEALELPPRARGRWDFFRSLARADVVVLHRVLLNFLEFAFLRRNARRLLFDYDDAVMHRDPFRRSPLSRKRMRRFARTVAGADGCIAGNPYLQDHALDCGAPGPVAVLPTPVDPARYPAGPPPVPGSAVLGWIGQTATLPYLQDLLPALETLALGRPGLSLRVVADACPPGTGALGLEFVRWSEETEGAALAAVDVGLMPLRDDPWSRGKCGYKILQYFAAGKPVVASPVGVNADLVLPGRTGFLARDDAEWAEGIGRLLDAPSARAAMGAEGRRLLDAGGYTLEAYVLRLGSVLRGSGP